ncbi:MAG: Arm DNA-binding domain-containing protein, partial [Candidatus Binatota bacterium]|nr:Arm DNA-binding domain-containing protein [Candidatus Binatota bacterium]
MRYNQAAVDRLTAPGWHHISDNLYLRIGPSDGRVWLFRYSRQGKNQWLGLGTAKDVTFKKAKKKAHGLRQA